MTTPEGTSLYTQKTEDMTNFIRSRLGMPEVEFVEFTDSEEAPDFDEADAKN